MSPRERRRTKKRAEIHKLWSRICGGQDKSKLLAQQSRILLERTLGHANVQLWQEGARQRIAKGTPSRCTCVETRLAATATKVRLQRDQPILLRLISIQILFYSIIALFRWLKSEKYLYLSNEWDILNDICDSEGKSTIHRDLSVRSVPEIQCSHLANMNLLNLGKGVFETSDRPRAKVASRIPLNSEFPSPRRSRGFTVQHPQGDSIRQDTKD